MQREELRVPLLEPEELAERRDLDLVDEVALVQIDLQIARDEDAEDHSAAAAAAAENGAEEAMALITCCRGYR